MKRRDLAGQKIGRLTVLSSVPNSGRRTRWLCRCDCGKEITALTSNLTREHTQSCGCYHADVAREFATGVYRSWGPNPYRFVSDSTVAIALMGTHDNVVAETLIDSTDLDLVMQHRWHYAGQYAVSTGEGHYNIGRIQMHNLLMRAALDAAPGLEVDHISRDKLDNRRSNLRVGTEAQNKANRVLPRGRSGYIGVCQYRKTDRWYAQARVKGVLTHLGFFSSPEEAAHVRDAAVIKEYGEFAVLNFPLGSSEVES